MENFIADEDNDEIFHDQEANNDENEIGSNSGPKHPIWKIFKRSEDGKKAKCPGCNVSISATTTICKKHLKINDSIHRKLQKQLDEEIKKSEISNKVKKRKLGSTSTQPTIVQAVEKYGNQSKRKKKCDAALANLLSMPSLSINSAVHPMFKKFINILDPKYEPPNSYNGLKALLSKTSDEKKIELKSLLSKLENKPSITLDLWTDPAMMSSYLGVTIHYIENFELKSAFLGLRECFLKTARAIRGYLADILLEYGFSGQTIEENVFRIVTDNGSNVCCAFKITEKVAFHEYCSLIEDLSAQVEKRMQIIFDTHYEKFDPLFLVASALAPETSQLLTEAELASSAAYIKAMIGNIEEPSSQEIETPQTDSQRLIDDFKSKMAAEFNRTRQASGSDLLATINDALKYIRNHRGNQDSIKIWSETILELEPIRNLAMKIFSCPATGAPIERIFSIAGINTARHRNRTKIDLLNSKLITYVNGYLRK